MVLGLGDGAGGGEEGGVGGGGGWEMHDIILSSRSEPTRSTVWVFSDRGETC